MSNEPKNARLLSLQAAAELYGLRSFDNYAQIRSLAEQIRDGLCEYLDPGQKCVYLVPPQGAFGSADYGSAAFSVTGKGFLPLEPISFGLAIKVSELGDFMRLVLHCRKEGERIFVQIENERRFEVQLPIEKDQLINAFEGLYHHLLGWFESRVDHYDNGDYGNSDIGFDIQRPITDE